MIPTPGQNVLYKLSDEDAQKVNSRREYVKQNPKIVEAGVRPLVESRVRPGDEFPMLITYIWNKGEDSLVNGHVMLEANDCLWVDRVKQGNGKSEFREFPRT